MNKKLALIITLLITTVIAQSTYDHLRRNLAENENIQETLNQLQKLEASPEVSSMILHAAFLLKDPEAGLDHGRKAIKADPQNPENYFRVAMLLNHKFQKNPMGWMTGKNEYLGNLEKAIELKPDHLDAYMGLIAWHREAPAFIGASKEKALAYATKLSKHDLPKGLIQQALVLEKDGKNEEAQALWTKMETQFANNADYIYHRTMSFIGSGEFQKAVEISRNYVTKNHDHQQLLYQAAKARIEGKIDPQGAIDLLDRFYAQTKSNTWKANALWRKGLALEQLEKNAEAKASYQEALTYQPNMSEAKKALKRFN